MAVRCVRIEKSCKGVKGGEPFYHLYVKKWLAFKRNFRSMRPDSFPSPALHLTPKIVLPWSQNRHFTCKNLVVEIHLELCNCVKPDAKTAPLQNLAHLSQRFGQGITGVIIPSPLLFPRPLFVVWACNACLYVWRCCRHVRYSAKTN